LPALAGGYHWDASCHCRRPNSEYTVKHYVRAPKRVLTRHRTVERTRVVRGKTKIIQENRVTVHVRPVLHREVVVHRTNTIVRDVIEHRVNPINVYRDVDRTQVVNVYRPGWVRHVTEYRNLGVVNCGCHYYGYHRGLFSSHANCASGPVVSYRD
jgi:hypothetical protein